MSTRPTGPWDGKAYIRCNISSYKMKEKDKTRRKDPKCSAKCLDYSYGFGLLLSVAVSYPTVADFSNSSSMHIILEGCFSVSSRWPSWNVVS
jgi:hypothetical protein